MSSRAAVAIQATHRAAEAGDTVAQFNLGVLLATRLDPPELKEARRWYTRAAKGGDAAVADAAKQVVRVL